MDAARRPARWLSYLQVGVVEGVEWSAIAAGTLHRGKVFRLVDKTKTTQTYGILSGAPEWYLGRKMNDERTATAKTFPWFDGCSIVRFALCGFFIKHSKYSLVVR